MVYHSSRRFIFTVAIILGCFSLALGQVEIRVNEAATRFHIDAKGPQLALTLKLPVENLTTRTIAAHVVVELVDPQGKIRSRGEQDVAFAPSSTALKIPLPPLSRAESKAKEEDDESGGLIWDRLRYAVTFPAAGAAKPLEGVISVSEITPQLFELHVAGPGIVSPGGHATLRVRALQPITAKPVAGVTVGASLEFAGGRKPLPARTAVTDREGFASLGFTLPIALIEENHPIPLKVTGTMGGYSASAGGDFYVARAAWRLR